MNWFSGRLEITWTDGTTTNEFDLSFGAACAYHEANKDRIRSAMYHPYSTEIAS